jgi:DNA ligase-1
MRAAATPADLNKLPYPVFASAKLDGIRCIIKDSTALSNSLKPIRNAEVQSVLGNPALNGLDGELIVGEPNASDCMRVTNSGIMSLSKQVDWKFYVFDVWNRPGGKYVDVLDHLYSIDHPNIEVLDQRRINSTKSLESLEARVLDEGYEGLIVRRPDGLYKFGRSTFRESYLVKIKRFRQAEGIIIGFEPWRKNLNDPELDALGYTHRSASKDGKVELPMLGSFLVEGPSPYYEHQVRFNVGTGFTINERIWFWENRFAMLNKPCTYKYFPTGSKEKPRHPVWVSLRDPDDLPL